MSGFLDDVRRCAFCHEDAHALMHYSEKRYAHGRCLVAAKGFEFVRTLPVGRLGNWTMGDGTTEQTQEILALVTKGRTGDVRRSDR